MTSLSKKLVEDIGCAISPALPRGSSFLLVVIGPENTPGNVPDFATCSNVELDLSRKIARGFLMHTAAEAEEN